jgi:hypothetical protein
MRWHLNILDPRSFRVSDCDTDHYLLVEKVSKRLAISKPAAQKFDVERFNLKMLSEQENRNHIRLRSQTGLQPWRT